MAAGIRSPRKEAERQIKYFETMKKNATEKYVAKIHGYDAKIVALEEQLPTLSDEVSAN
jgi:hypothetical protein